MNLSWWIWPVALVAAVLVLAYFARKSWRAGVRNGFRAHLAANLPEWQLVEERSSELVLRHPASDTTLPFQIESLYGAVIEAKAESPEDRSKLYAQAAGALTEALEAQGALNPERDLPRILPRLVRREFIDASQAQGLVHQPLSGTDLFISYVIDRANSVQYLMEPHREELGEDLIRLHERALENLAQKVPLEGMRAAFTSGQVNVLKTMDQTRRGEAAAAPLAAAGRAHRDRCGARPGHDRGRAGACGLELGVDGAARHRGSGPLATAPSASGIEARDRAEVTAGEPPTRSQAKAANPENVM